MLQFKIGDIVSFTNNNIISSNDNNINKNKYRLNNIICETTGSMKYGHTNTYYGVMENLNNGEIITTVVGIIELSTNGKIFIYIESVPL